jgi:hypothetical protein
VRSDDPLSQGLDTANHVSLSGFECKTEIFRCTASRQSRGQFNCCPSPCDRLCSRGMEDYQQHLQRQLQQQQAQLGARNPDPNTPRSITAQPLQRSLQATAQWTPNNQGQPSASPAGPSYGRGIGVNPMSGTPQQQPLQQQTMQGQTGQFSSSPQTNVQNVNSPTVPQGQQSQSSPVPGSPVMSLKGESRMLRIYFG